MDGVEYEYNSEGNESMIPKELAALAADKLVIIIY
jgi:hypothetical protein